MPIVTQIVHNVTTTWGSGDQSRHQKRAGGMSIPENEKGGAYQQRSRPCLSQSPLIIGACLLHAQRAVHLPDSTPTVADASSWCWALLLFLAGHISSDKGYAPAVQLL